MGDLAEREKGWSFHYGSEVVHFSVRRQPLRRKDSISIHVEPEGTVVVDAPVHASRTAILAAVCKRSRWIQGHAARSRRRRAHVLPREYVSGESIMYLGRHYRLKVIRVDADDVSVKLIGAYLQVCSVSSEPAAIRQAMEEWFRARARTIFAERLDTMLSELRWTPFAPAMRLQAMRVQWGSCSPTGQLTLNPWLVKAPRDCIDYVLLHELCHLKEHNHSPRFFRLLDKHMPRWRERKARLDDLAEVILNR